MFEQDLWAQALKDFAREVNENGGLFIKPENTREMKEICTASDSGQPRRMCWCAECAEIRKEYGVRKQREKKEYAY